MATSFKDPIWDRIEEGVAKTLGIPAKLIASIRTKGERSNSDQVSEAGARSVYQIIPATRAAIQKKYGVDAYASPKDAALAAGYVLKEGLDRNGGNQREAIAEYHAGTDKRNRGPVNRAYVARVTGGGDQPSTFDRIKSQEQPSGPSISKVYDAYKAGKMQPQEAAQFEHDVQTGAVMLPRGGALRKKPAVFQLPSGVVKAYNGREMSDEDRAQVDADLRDGVVALPRGAKLQRPAARTMGEGFGMGVRNAAVGLGGLADIVGGPVNSIINALPGEQGLSLTPGQDLANSVSDAIGLAKPESSGEMLASAIQQGGVQGIATAGLGALGAGAKGATGAVARALTAAPVVDTVSGAASGAGSEVARQSGAGPVGQLIAGLGAGGLPALAHPVVKAKIGRNAGRDIVEATQAPKEALIDPEGNLTPDGQEVAAQNGITPTELKQAYGEAPPGGVANDVPTEQVAARAVGQDLPIEQIDIAPPMRATPDETAPPVQEAPTPTPQSPEALPETALARVQQGQDVGVDYSRGQATKSFDVQDAEMRLRNSNGPEGEAARQFVSTQIEQIKAAKDKFTSAFGDSDPELAQEAMRDLRDAGARGVSALYKAAENVDGEGIGLLTDNIRAKAMDVLIDPLVDEGAKTDLGRQLARYGIVGKADKMNEVGLTTSTLDDGKQVQFRGEVGPLTASNAEDLRQAVNRIYRADPQKNFPVLNLLPAIDDAFMDAIDTAIKQTGKDASAKGSILKEARAASKELNRTFNASDVVSDIVGWKKGLKGVTSKLKPEQVMQRALATTSDLKRIKAVLLSTPNEKSRAAWRAIQAHGLAKIFSDATTKTTNVAGEITDAISGAKLRSSVERFGKDKLKVLLDADDFNNMMKLQRVIEDVTIPISGTVNTSNSGNLIMRLLGNVETKVTGAFAAAGAMVGGPAGAAAGGTGGQAVGTAMKMKREAKAAAETLEGVTNYTPSRAAAETADAPAKPKAPSTTIKDFIDTYKSERLLAPIIASGSQGDEE